TSSRACSSGRITPPSRRSTGSVLLPRVSPWIRRPRGSRPRKPPWRAATPSRSGCEEAPMGEGSATILLVDDEPLVLGALTRHVQLRRRGWRVLRAEDGAEALRTVAREPVDAIVTDVQMPGKDG